MFSCSRTYQLEFLIRLLWVFRCRNSVDSKCQDTEQACPRNIQPRLPRWKAFDMKSFASLHRKTAGNLELSIFYPFADPFMWLHAQSWSQVCSGMRFAGSLTVSPLPRSRFPRWSDHTTRRPAGQSAGPSCRSDVRGWVPRERSTQTPHPYAARASCGGWVAARKKSRADSGRRPGGVSAPGLVIASLPDAESFGIGSVLLEQLAHTRDATGPLLHVVVEAELVRVRSETHGVDFALALVPDPRVDHVRREHVAAEQELVVGP